MEEQREVDCRRVVAVVEQTLCHVERCRARTRLVAVCILSGAVVDKSVEDEFVLAYTVYRQFVAVAQFLFDIICVQGSQFAGEQQIAASEREYI